MHIGQTITTRESEVLELISLEYTSKELAKKLFISQNTAETHRKNLLNKLGVKNAAGLVRKGFELGILQVG